MVLKVQFTSGYSAKTAIPTDWAILGGKTRNPQRLVLPDSPHLLVAPKKGVNGLIEYHGTELPLYGDKTFFYAAWPQKKVLPVIQEQLNDALRHKKIRTNGYYYTLNGLAHKEYPVGDHLYVLVKDSAVWMEVLPIKWVFDMDRKKAYSEQIVMADTHKSDNYMNLISQQIMYANKFIREHMKEEKESIETQKRELKSGILRGLRTLRDLQTPQKVPQDIKGAYSIFMKTAIKRNKRS